MSDKLRLRFEKSGRAVYISHLDLMATMQRAFSRAELPLQYSEGFNPHPLISILLPLPVGTASRCELMDFRLKEAVFPGRSFPEDLPQRLSAALPEGIRALEVYPAERKSNLLKWLRVEGRLDYDGALPEIEALDRFYAQREIVIEKKSKRGLGPADIRPGIREIAFERLPEAVETRSLLLRAVVSAQEPTLNPELLCSALRQLAPAMAPDFAAFTRLETYDAEGGIYR